MPRAFAEAERTGSARNNCETETCTENARVSLDLLQHFIPQKHHVKDSRRCIRDGSARYAYVSNVVACIARIS
jgi:hypothetical protein